MKPRAIGVIPARWGSTRFPGKSLALIGGRPLLAWVVDRARQARRLEEILVATDDERIASAARGWGVRAVMTRADHSSGTDRIAEAVQGLAADVVVNIQGDEPLIEPALIDRVAEALTGAGDWDLASGATPIRSAEELHNPDVVKVVRAADGRALYFSRSVIPHVRGAAAPCAPSSPSTRARNTLPSRMARRPAPLGPCKVSIPDMRSSSITMSRLDRPKLPSEPRSTGSRPSISHDWLGAGISWAASLATPWGPEGTSTMILVEPA